MLKHPGTLMLIMRNQSLIKCGFHPWIIPGVIPVLKNIRNLSSIELNWICKSKMRSWNSYKMILALVI